MAQPQLKVLQEIDKKIIKKSSRNFTTKFSIAILL